MAENSGSDESYDPPPAKLMRKEWLKTGNVPRSTLMRWNKQNNFRDGLSANHESEESSQSTSNTSSSSDDSEQQESDNDLSDNGDDEEGGGGGDDGDGGESGDDGGGGGDDDGGSGGDDDGGDNRDDNDEEFAEMLFNFQFHPEPLYERSRITCGEAIVGLMSLYSEHAMSKSCLRDLVKFIHGLLPVGNSFPSSYHFLHSAVKPFIPPNSNIKHYCCEGCGMYLGKLTGRAEACTLCQSTNFVVFHEFYLPTLIKYLFEMRNLADAMDVYEDRKGGDITRSEEYRRVKENLPGRYDVVINFNFDGVQTHKSSSVQMWPFVFNVVDVAPQAREKYTLVAGLWHAKKKPNVNSYLLPFAESLIKLSTEGVTWVHPRTKQTHTSKVLAPIVSVDGPARAMAQNLLQHNGEFSCNVCEIEGMELRLGPRSRKRVVPFPEEPAPLRTQETMKEAATRAEYDNAIVKGVKGSSILEAIPECDTAKGVILDYMHLVLLGCVRTFFELWFTKNGYDWYIGRKKRRVNAFLKTIRRTYETTRCPSDATKWKVFKASTWRTWLLFVSLPALQGILPEKYLQHWTYLVVGIALLLQENISENDRVLSEHLLSIFVRDTQELYGYSAMTYNLHGLLHLPLMVRRWGGLWGPSLFKFEGLNGMLTRLLHGTIRISAELSNTLDLIIATNTLKFLMHHDRDVQAERQPILLSPQDFRAIPDAERQALAAHFPVGSTFKVFARAQIRRHMYTSDMYTAERSTDNKNVCYKNGQLTMYGVVQFYVECNDVLYAVICKLLVEPERCFKINEIGLVVRHIIPVRNTDVIQILPLSVISHKVMRVHDFVVEDLNHFEQKL